MQPIAKADLKTAGGYLKAHIMKLGARVSHVRVRQNAKGLYATARVNDRAVEVRMPFGVIEWSYIAQQLINAASDAGGVAQVM